MEFLFTQINVQSMISKLRNNLFKRMKKETYPFVEDGNKLLVLNKQTREYEEYKGRIPGLVIAGKARNCEIRLDDISIFDGVTIEMNGSNHYCHLGGSNKRKAIVSASWILFAYDHCYLDIGDDMNIRYGCGFCLVEPRAACIIGTHFGAAELSRFLASDGHPIVDRTTREVINYSPTKKPFRIGDYCWVGMGAYLLKNTVLPDHTGVGAHSVVTRAFTEPYTILAGYPARVIRTNVERVDVWTDVKFPQRETMM